MYVLLNPPKRGISFSKNAILNSDFRNTMDSYIEHPKYFENSVDFNFSAHKEEAFSNGSNRIMRIVKILVLN